MTQERKHALIPRVYSLTVQAFDYFKAFQRMRQLQVDLAEEPRTVTNSEALGFLLHEHSSMSLAASMSGLTVLELARVLTHGELVLTKPAA